MKRNTQNKTTSYPLLRYCSILLALSLLFAGVTFARYASGGSVSTGVSISAFDAGYSIDRVNTTTFGNQDYWMNVSDVYVDQGAGTAISVGMTLKNNGGTNVQPTLRLSGPADYWDNLAIEVMDAEADGSAGERAYTPQLVLADLLRERTVIDAYNVSYGGYRTWGADEPFSTEGSLVFGQRGETERVLTMNGALTAEGGEVTAVWTEEGKEATLRITAEKRTEQYSVGFVRKRNAELLPPLYVECEKEMTVYTVELTLPALDLAARSGEIETRLPVVIFLTWTNDLPNRSEAATSGFWDTLLSASAPFELANATSDGQSVTILGYHFDVGGVNVVDAGGNATGEETSVRLQTTLGGGVAYFHVAGINDYDGSYVHPMQPYEYGGSAALMQCLNKDESKRIIADVTGISAVFRKEEISMTGDNGYAPIQQRGFRISFAADFVQSSELPFGGASI